MSDFEELTQERLKELLHYDPLSGIFTWLERDIKYFNHCKNPEHQCNAWNAKNANQEAGNIYTPKNKKTSYVVICITLNEKKKFYRAHRLAILYTEGHWPAEQVDHIDGDGTNNRKDNLREVNDQENSKNRPMQSNNTSGTVGVCWSKAAKKWHVQMSENGKKIHGGFFINKEEAIAKRKELEIEQGYHKNHGRKRKGE